MRRNVVRQGARHRTEGAWQRSDGYRESWWKLTHGTVPGSGRDTAFPRTMLGAWKDPDYLKGQPGWIMLLPTLVSLLRGDKYRG
jgi:hypothetical protein